MVRIRRLSWLLLVPVSLGLATGAQADKTAKKRTSKAPGAAATRKSHRRSAALAMVSARRASASAAEQAAASGGRTDKHGQRRRASGVLPPDRFPPLKLEAVNTGEKVSFRLYDRQGRTLRPSVRKIWHLLRCHLTQKERPIHWRLIRSLYRVSRRFPGKTIQVYSGYRARRVASLPNSNHVKGRAVDFHVDGVSNKNLRDFLLATFKPVGVGYYPNAPFVHLDVRDKQSAFWVDTSGKGEASEYASNPHEVIRAEKTAGRTKITERAKNETGPGAKAANRDADGSEGAGKVEAQGAEAATPASRPSKESRPTPRAPRETEEAEPAKTSPAEATPDPPDASTPESSPSEDEGVVAGPPRGGAGDRARIVPAR
jgi:uncharacterized protein YcbK (DUF882 family)